MVLSYNIHAYAADNQLLIHCKPEDAQTSVESLEKRVGAISSWMSANRLKPNDKTEFVWTGIVKGIYKTYVTAVKL